MKSSTSFRFFFFFFVLAIAAIAAIAEDSNAEEEEEDSYLRADQCVYTLNVKTGTVKSAGTDSRISIRLGDGRGSSITIPNLRDWGVMRPGHDYFENGNLDFFVVNGPCLPSPVCRITITSDGTGNKPGWYLDYVDVTTTGPNRARARNLFQVNQWLAISSAPFQLSTSRNRCGALAAGEEGLDIANDQVHADFVVGRANWE